MQHESVRYRCKLAIPGIQRKNITMFIMKIIKVQFRSCNHNNLFFQILLKSRHQFRKKEKKIKGLLTL